MFSGPTVETVNLKMVHLRHCSIKLGTFKPVMEVKSACFDPRQWKRATAGLGLELAGLELARAR